MMDGDEVNAVGGGGGPWWPRHRGGGRGGGCSRIVRVSRGSGGKDRHSKVLTAKGLRDRRVRLSVPTAIQFYELQDRLGFDQPSKAVEWLIHAASAAIADLPSLDGAAQSHRLDSPSSIEELLFQPPPISSSMMEDHLMPIATTAAAAGGGEYKGLRGPLQSNSASQFAHHHHLEKISSSSYPPVDDGENLPFFFSPAGTTAVESQFFRLGSAAACSSLTANSKGREDRMGSSLHSVSN